MFCFHVNDLYRKRLHHNIVYIGLNVQEVCEKDHYCRYCTEFEAGWRPRYWYAKIGRTSQVSICIRGILHLSRGKHPVHWKRHSQYDENHNTGNRKKHFIGIDFICNSFNPSQFFLLPSSIFGNHPWRMKCSTRRKWHSSLATSGCHAQKLIRWFPPWITTVVQNSIALLFCVCDAITTPLSVTRSDVMSHNHCDVISTFN